MLILSCLITMHGGKPYFGDWRVGGGGEPKPFNIGLDSDIYRSISFKLSKIIDINKLYSLMPV